MGEIIIGFLGVAGLLMGLWALESAKKFLKKSGDTLEQARESELRSNKALSDALEHLEEARLLLEKCERENYSK